MGSWVLILGFWVFKKSQLKQKGENGLLGFQKESTHAKRKMGSWVFKMGFWVFKKSQLMQKVKWAPRFSKRASGFSKRVNSCKKGKIGSWVFLMGFWVFKKSQL